MICIFDSSALLAMLRGEHAGDTVREVLRDARNASHIHALNLCEVYYIIRREYGEPEALAKLAELTALGLTTQEKLDTALWQDAGRMKADYRRVSLADCCGLALARRMGGTFLTTDRHELDNDAILALCPIQFIR